MPKKTKRPRLKKLRRGSEKKIAFIAVTCAEIEQSAHKGVAALHGVDQCAPPQKAPLPGLAADKTRVMSANQTAGLSQNLAGNRRGMD